jgi:hypothetical protein
LQRQTQQTNAIAPSLKPGELLPEKDLKKNKTAGEVQYMRPLSQREGNA